MTPSCLKQPIHCERCPLNIGFKLWSGGKKYLNAYDVSWLKYKRKCIFYFYRCRHFSNFPDNCLHLMADLTTLEEWKHKTEVTSNQLVGRIFLIARGTVSHCFISITPTFVFFFCTHSIFHPLMGVKVRWVSDNRCTRRCWMAHRLRVLFIKVDCLLNFTYNYLIYTEQQNMWIAFDFNSFGRLKGAMGDKKREKKKKWK